MEPHKQEALKQRVDCAMRLILPALVLLTACGPRVVDPSLAESACADGMSPACEQQLLADAAYVGPEDPSVAEALLLVLEVSPGWYADTVSQWSELDADADYGDAVATAKGRKVVLHAAWSWEPEVLAAALIHEAAHASSPIGARHHRCDWDGGCDNGEPSDGYPRVVDFIRASGWTSPVAEAIAEEAKARSHR